ncbi:TPA: ribulokinase [Vibrio parahaemolyticus]|uniref:ribulokinase n=1 Tax=Vibrio parahaemolyticus TaxID=670 RepID=UPI000946C00E|nr:ribulokinase [Vibrio parahaemolyticus]OLF45789.1 ribulokinase [Vibrio parahaemolyticus]HCM1078238.1 ribulokinase [Vibrio parahaemolyticus]HCM1082611.1 ribulokinase [Vibrio parahaemolyticus]
MSVEKYTIGLDFGSDSVRALLVNTTTGQEVACGVQYYPRWMEGQYCHAAMSQFRQHPRDYIEAMTAAVKETLAQVSEQVRQSVVGIGVDTTGSTPAPVDKDGNVLALLPEFEHNPNAMFILWKDHTSIQKAERINQLAHSGDFPDYTRYVGGIYSSEWFWAKAAWIGEQDAKVSEQAYTWVELCDWIPALISGNQAPNKLRRGICAAGHKALWHDEWNGLPSQEFLSAISPTLDGIRERMFDRVYTSDQQAGLLSAEWAERFGLPEGIAVAIGEFDCHMGAVGAGQSAFGDVYAWYKRLLMWPIQQWVAKHPEDQHLLDNLDNVLIPMLADAAIEHPQTEHSPLSLDWHNGRRTPNANQRLKGVVSGLNLGSSAPDIFYSLVESTAHGAKAIMDCMTTQGVDVNRVLAIGGIAQKSPLVMQTCADVMGRDIAVVESDQCCALGAAIFAAVAADAHTSVSEAQAAMASPIRHVYTPVQRRADFYQGRHQAYSQLGQHIETFTDQQKEA